MKAIVVLAAVISASLSAANAAEHDRLMAAGGCTGAPAGSYCEQSATQFRSEYPRALKGDYGAQRNVAYCLITGCDGAVTRNLPLGCAWRAVILASGSTKIDAGDRMNFDGSCRGKLTGSEATTFGGQYETLFKRIYRRTAPAIL